MTSKDLLRNFLHRYSAKLGTNSQGKCEEKCVEKTICRADQSSIFVVQFRQRSTCDDFD